MSIARAARDAAVLGALLVSIAACAGSHPPAPVVQPSQSRAVPPPAQPAVQPPPAPPAERELTPAVAADPGVAAVSARLAGAPAAQRPRLLLERARAAMAAAQSLRPKTRTWGPIPAMDKDQFVEFYEAAQADCEEVLEKHPGAPEAAETLFTLGEMQDYPHLSDFALADRAYAATIERYPGTPAARKATAAMRRLREYLGDPNLPPPPKP